MSAFLTLSQLKLCRCVNITHTHIYKYFNTANNIFYKSNSLLLKNPFSSASFGNQK